MTDIYTVIFTGEADGRADSIPWIVTFADLELAKNHVREEAHFRARAEETEPEAEWTDCEDHSTLVLRYDLTTLDTWTIVRTELVETDPSGTISGL